MEVRKAFEELVLEELEPESAEPVPIEPTCFAPTAMPFSALLPELEPNRVEAVAAALPAGSGEALEFWIEPTCQVAVEVDVESLDVERFAPTAREPVVDRGTCRYCQAPSAPGQAFCDHCGMHLERFEASAAAVPEAAPVRCRTCGTPATGERCPACGNRVPGMRQ